MPTEACDELQSIRVGYESLKRLLLWSHDIDVDNQNCYLVTDLTEANLHYTVILLGNFNEV